MSLVRNLLLRVPLTHPQSLWRRPLLSLPRKRSRPYVIFHHVMSCKSLSEDVDQDAPEAAKKDDAPRSPGLLSRILAPFKQVEKKVKAPKSPKKEKKKDEVSIR